MGITAGLLHHYTIFISLTYLNNFRGVEELKESVSRQQERFQREKEAAVLAARVEAQVAALGTDSNAGDSTLQQIDTDNQKKVETITVTVICQVVLHICFG